MFNAPVIVFAIIFSFLSARDIYVSKASLSQYEKDDYLLFDSFNDTLEAAHSRHPNYYPAVDAVDLGENGPILGPNFTQEVRIFTDKGRLDPDWGHIMAILRKHCHQMMMIVIPLREPWQERLQIRKHHLYGNMRGIKFGMDSDQAIGGIMHT